MSKPSLPNPHEPLVDIQTGKVRDVWFRYLSQELAQSNALTDVVGGLSTGTTGLTAVAFSSFATQVEQEATTAATAVVTPSVQQFHPSAAKVWGHVTLAGTVATIASQYNLATAVSTATGFLRVGFSVAFSSTSYSVNYGVVDDNSGATNISTIVTSDGLASTGFTLLTQGFNGTNLDPRAYFITCYGDQ